MANCQLMKVAFPEALTLNALFSVGGSIAATATAETFNFFFKKKSRKVGGSEVSLWVKALALRKPDDL